MNKEKFFWELFRITGEIDLYLSMKDKKMRS